MNWRQDYLTLHKVKAANKPAYIFNNAKRNTKINLKSTTVFNRSGRHLSAYKKEKDKSIGY